MSVPVFTINVVNHKSNTDLCYLINLFVSCRRLMTQLESFKPSQKKPSTPQSKDATPSDSVRYELFYRPEQAQFSKNAKVSSLGFSSPVQKCR